MAPSPDEQLNGRVTLRDLNRVEATQEKILAEIKALELKVDGKFDAHAAKHEADGKAHQAEHSHDRKERRGLTLWAVTTIMSGIGVLIALYLALRA